MLVHLTWVTLFVYLFIGSNVTACTVHVLYNRKKYLLFSVLDLFYITFFKFLFIFYFFEKAAELVSLNLAEYEAHFLDIRCYLEQKLLVSPYYSCLVQIFQ